MFDYKNCKICPRECGVDRTNNQYGVCRMSSKIHLARAALHFWEEPCISGEKGSGAVFFSGCNLGCVYCQNKPISRGEVAKEIDDDRLCEIFFELKEQGAANINLISGGHFLPHIISSIEKAKKQGFDLPFVYNTGSYEKVEAIKALDGLIDIYLPDYKYHIAEDGKKYSFCADYPTVADKAIKEMVRQKPKPVFIGDYMTGGVIIRHLLLPGKIIESKIALKHLFDKYQNNVYYSIMSQYTPLPWVKDYPELDRCVTSVEYKSLVDYCEKLGMENAFVQEGSAAKESFIPEFNYEGV